MYTNIDIYEMASRQFPLFEKLESHLTAHGTMEGIKIGWHCHLTSLTAIAAECLLAAGADLILSECSEATTESSAVEKMKAAGAKVYLGRDSTNKTLNESPSVLSDTGLVLISAYLEKAKTEGLNLRNSPKGASEITSSGISRLRETERQMSLPLTVVNLNDGILKSHIENFHGVGDGLIDALKMCTGRSFAGEIATVAGYGKVGAGAAKYLKEAGCLVNIVETDPVRALLAHYDGFALTNLEQGLSKSKLFISATGKKSLLNEREWIRARDGLIAINLGHWQEELNLSALGEASRSQERLSNNLTAFVLKESGNTIYVMTEGAPANVALLTGTIEPTLIHLAVELLTMKYLLEKGSLLDNGETALPYEIEKAVSELALQALKIG